MKKAGQIFRLSLATLLTSLSSASFAGAFMLQEQNAVQTGDFGAGGAAIAEDASTAWFNPAGLVRIDKPQIVVAGNQINFNTAFTGNVNYLNTAVSNTTIYGSVSNATGGTNNFVPVFYASYPINSNLVSALSVNTPFGLSTNYGNDDLVRYATVQTKLKTINISPSLGFKINNKISLGAGIDFQRLLATLSSYAGLSPAFPEDDTFSQNKASDWAEGWHAGILYLPSNTTRFGLAYHSKFVHHAEGNSVFDGPLDANNNGPISSSDAKTTVYFPASTTLSAYHDMNNRWALMGSVVYTQWSIFKNLTLQNVAAVDSNLIPITNLTVNVPQNFHNTWRASIGANYKVNGQWLLRTGIGFDQDPTNNTDRNLRLPDGNRYGVAVGAHYQATKDVGLDGGYTHEFIRTAQINNTSVTSTQQTTAIGHSYSSADVIGLQLTWSFA